MLATDPENPFASAIALVAALRRGDVSATELTAQAIARIQAQDGALNAVVVRDFERARLAAADADVALRRGEAGALLGVPVTVKEAFNVAGLPTTWGVPGAAPEPALLDAVAVQRLRRAGAIVLGKTNVPTQLADWQTDNPVYGRSHNPWNLAHAPGGSSGGAAAALAAGFVPLELGSDLNGSLRNPAHACGVYAHKPSHGLVPMRGMAPPGTPLLSVQPDIDFGVAGPMARSAADLALALDVLAGPDDAQATAWQLALPAPRHRTLAAHRVLVLDRHPLLPTSDAVCTALHGLADRLARAGCTVRTAHPALPDLGAIAAHFGRMLMAFFGADMPMDNYRALQAQVAALPPAAGALDALELRGMVLSHRDWLQADRARAAIAHQWRQLFAEVDLVLCPVAPTTALPHASGEMHSRTLLVDGRAVPYTLQGLWCTLASFSDLPATAMPVAQDPASGLPIGVQAIGPALEDRTPLAFAALVEEAFGGFRPPPGGSAAPHTGPAAPSCGG